MGWASGFFSDFDATSTSPLPFTRVRNLSIRRRAFAKWVRSELSSARVFSRSWRKFSYSINSSDLDKFSREDLLMDIDIDVTDDL